MIRTAILSVEVSSRRARRVLYPLSLVALLISFAAHGEVHPRLPAETILNKGAGRGELLLVTLRLETGEKLLFILDTGAPGTLFDKSLEPKLGKSHGRKEIAWFGGKYNAGVYESPKLFLGDAQLMMEKRVRTFDFKMLHYPGPPIMGVLGMDCLRHYGIQLDFAAGKMRFFDPTALPKDGLGEAFPLISYLPLSMYRGCFYVRGNLVEAKGANTLIDTGCNFDGILTPKLFHQWTNAPSMKGHESVFPNGGLGKNYYAQLQLSGEGDVNLLGLGILGRNLVTFNFPKRMMYLKPVAK